MTILGALQSASIKLLGRRPSVFFGASDTFENELCDLVNEVAADAAQYQDWQALLRTTSIAGNGVATEFDLPEDYDRMPINADVADLQTWFWGFQGFTDINAFLLSEARNFNAYPGGWIIYGNKMRFAPAPTATQIATFPYITKNWARGADGSTKSAFTSDTDDFLLPERLLRLGLVWRWRENKKLDASGDQEAFIRALDEHASKDKGSRIQRKSARRNFPGTYPAWPGLLGPSTYQDH